MRSNDLQKTSDILSKVPAVTLGFWVIKILATTLGETGGDAVTMSWLHADQNAQNGGYLIGTAIFLAIFVAAVITQISTTRRASGRLCFTELHHHGGHDHSPSRRFRQSIGHLSRCSRPGDYNASRRKLWATSVKWGTLAKYRFVSARKRCVNTFFGGLSEIPNDATLLPNK